MVDYMKRISQKLDKMNHTMDLTDLKASCPFHRIDMCLQNAINLFAAAAKSVEQERTKIGPQHNIDSLNDRLIFTERQFLGSGIPKRPYFRHVIQVF